MVGRNPFNSRFHALTAGGFLASLALIALLAIPALRHWTVWGLLSLALAAMLAGGLMVGWRRRVEKPPELSKGRFSRLPFALLAYAAAFLVVALDQAAGGVLPWPLSLALVLVGAWGCAELVLGVWKGPLKHAVHGALHLVAHPRPERFHDGLGRDTALRPLDLETNGKLGAERPVDFDWNRLLGFDACVQCGRCETACPAYAAGLPLNPKKLIQDLVTALEDGADDSSYAGNGHPGRPLGLAHGGPVQPVIGPHGPPGHALGLHHLPRLRAGMPDDDRARRCRDRPPPFPDARTRRHPRQGRRSAGGAARRPTTPAAARSPAASTGPWT